MDEPDEALVGRMQAGDAAAFEQLLARHAAVLHALLRRLADPGEVDDLWQEAVLLAWRDRHRLRRPDRVRAWLAAIVRNRCRDAAKRTDPEPLADPDAMVGTAWGRRPARLLESVREAVDELPQPERDAVSAFYYEGCSIAEIAARTRCPEGTVKRRLHTARSRLRGHFGVPGDDHEA